MSIFFYLTPDPAGLAFVNAWSLQVKLVAEASVGSCGVEVIGRSPKLNVHDWTLEECLLVERCNVDRQQFADFPKIADD